MDNRLTGNGQSFALHLTTFLAVNKTGVSFAAAGICISDAPEHRLAGVSLLSFLLILESP